MAQDNLIAGPHLAIYEALYMQADSTGAGLINAQPAACVLRKSGLPQNVLHHIWTLSDPEGKGQLDRRGFFVALKLISFAQSGRPLELSAIQSESTAPKMESRPASPAVSASGSPALAASLSPSRNSLSPRGPTPNNALNYESFSPTLSPARIPGSPGGSSLTTTTLPDVSAEPWLIADDEKIKYDAMFATLNPQPQVGNLDGTMVIMGDKVKQFLLNTKLPVDVLGKIWEYSDIDKDGALDAEEFALTMYLVQSALKGEPLPPALPLRLIPPKKRLVAQANGIPVISSTPTPGMPAAPSLPPPAVGWVVTAADKAVYDQTFKKADQDLDGFVNGIEIKDIFLQSGLPQNVLAHIWSLADGDDAGKLNQEQFAVAMWLVKRALGGVEPPPSLTPEMIPPSMRKAVLLEGFDDANREIERIAEEVDVITKDKNQLERDCAQQEADVKIKQGELVCLRADLDATLNTVQQLEKQKGEAQKRLDDLDSQISRLSSELHETIQRVEQEQQRRSEEDQLNASRVELHHLREEEKRLEVRLATWKVRMQSIAEEESKIFAETDTLKEVQESLMSKNQELSHSVIHLTNIVEGEVSLPDRLPDPVRVSPLDRSKLSSHIVNASLFDGISSFQSSISKSTAPDPFDVSSVDPFKEDPFGSFGQVPETADPFKDDADPFVSGSGDTSAKTQRAALGSFSDFDPFSSLGGKTDDPFSSSSSVPDLPPKLSKAVPPRPLAPPARPATGPSPRPSPVPPALTAAVNSGSSPVPKRDSLNPSPLPKLNPVRPAPSRPSKPPTSGSALEANSLFPDSSADPFAATDLSAEFSSRVDGSSSQDPFSCLHMPPPKSESGGSLSGTAHGTGANTPASFIDDAFGTSDPFGEPPDAAPSSNPASDAFDPFGIGKDNSASKDVPVTNGTNNVNNDLFSSLDAFSAQSEPIKPAPTAFDDDPFAAKGTSNGFGDAFDAKFEAKFEEKSGKTTPFDAFDSVDAAFGSRNADYSGGAPTEDKSDYPAFDAFDFADAAKAADSKPASTMSNGGATVTSTNASNTSTSSSFLGLLHKPLSKSTKDSSHSRERKKADGPSKSKNGTGGKKSDRLKAFSGSGAATGSEGGGMEDAQLEWARRESMRAEDERRRKMAEQEAADLEFALALSRAEAQSGKA